MLGAVVTVAVVVAACDTSGTLTADGHAHRPEPTRTRPTALAPAPPAGERVHPVPSPPYTVVDETVTLTDPSRMTPPRGAAPATTGRVLVTAIRRPVGPVGPLPLVVFAHGWDSDPGRYETLLDTWAEAGFLVAAPTFPDSADSLPGTPVSDYPDQARDISFVISSLLGGPVGPVDPDRIAVAGHSDGGTDVTLLALDPTFADPRVRAYLCLSGEIPPDVPGPWAAPTVGALLVAVGTDDEYGLLPKSTTVFRSADVQAKVMLTVSGGDHLDTFVGTSATAIAVRNDTVRFLEAAFAGQDVTSGGLASALRPTGDLAVTVTAG